MRKETINFILVIVFTLSLILGNICDNVTQKLLALAIMILISLISIGELCGKSNI